MTGNWEAAAIWGLLGNFSLEGWMSPLKCEELEIIIAHTSVQCGTVSTS